MHKVLILVEGQTEERFVKDVLQPYMWTKDVHPEPKIVVTKTVKHGTDFKGGITAFQKVEHDIRRLLGDSGATLITTMIDFYGLPDDFPGKQELRRSNAHEYVKELELALEAHFHAGSRFVAYFMLHEFEAFLFSDSAVLAGVMNEPTSRPSLEAIRNAFPTPEDINDNPTTTPSARVRKVFPGYRKRLHGPLTTGRIGLGTIRRECKHFDEWLGKLERCASS